MSIAMVSSPAYVYMDISQRNETLFMNETWGQPGKTRMNSTQNLGHQCGVHEYIIPDDSPDKHGKNESHIAHVNHLWPLLSWIEAWIS